MKLDFIKAVEDNDLSNVRMSLSNELLLDPRGATFSEMLKYAQENLTNLFEDNKPSDYTVPPKEEWNEDFLFVVKNDLDSNFSKEKLAFYEAVIKVVGKSKAEKIEIEEAQKKTEERARQRRQREKRPINKTYATISAGGATLALVGLVAGKTLLTVVGGAVLVVGGVLLINEQIQSK